MKNKLVLLLSLAMFLALPIVKAQTTPSTPPDGSDLKKDADYAKYEGKVKEYVTWYINGKVDKDTTLRLEVAGFLIKWVSGAPNVTVSIGEVATNLLDQKKFDYNTDMLVAYMGGIAVYELNNPNDKDEANIEVAGLQAVLDMAKNNTAQFDKAKALKKIKGLDKAGLLKYVKDCLEKQKKEK